MFKTKINNLLIEHRRLRKLYSYAPFLLPLPSLIYFDCGSECNFRCKQCDMWKMKTSREDRLTLEQNKEVIIKLNKWLGKFRLTFMGGEPLLHKGDLFELITLASNLEIYTSLTSNGSLINESIAKKLVKCGLKEIHISIDGLEKTHDKLRGVPLAYSRAISAVKIFRQIQLNNPSLNIYINTTPMRQNLDELVEIVKIAKRIGGVKIAYQVLSSKTSYGGRKYDKNWWKKSNLWPSPKKLSKIFDELIELKNSGFPIEKPISFLEKVKVYYSNPIKYGIDAPPCVLGFRHLFFDTSGDVRLCIKFNSIGNILKDDIRDIWYGNLAQKQREKIRTHLRECKMF